VSRLFDEGEDVGDALLSIRSSDVVAVAPQNHYPSIGNAAGICDRPTRQIEPQHAKEFAFGAIVVMIVISTPFPGNIIILVLHIAYIFRNWNEDARQAERDEEGRTMGAFWDDCGRGMSTGSAKKSI